MAITETKILQVENSPSIINSTNNEWGHFGWSVLGVQITHSQDTKTYTRGLDYYTGDKTVETTTINYATITYQRNKEMSNYRKIVELENEYIGILNEIDGIYESMPNDEINIKILLVLLLTIWGAVLYLGIKLFRKAQNKAALQNQSGKIRELSARRDEIFRKADALLF